MQKPNERNASCPCWQNPAFSWSWAAASCSLACPVLPGHGRPWLLASLATPRVRDAPTAETRTDRSSPGWPHDRRGPVATLVPGHHKSGAADHRRTQGTGQGLRDAPFFQWPAIRFDSRHDRAGTHLHDLPVGRSAPVSDAARFIRGPRSGRGTDVMRKAAGHRPAPTAARPSTYRVPLRARPRQL